MLSVWWSEFLVLELRTASLIIFDTAEYEFFGCFQDPTPERVKQAGSSEVHTLDVETLW